MKTILIPTDFSDTARNAMHYAISLFGRNNTFILMNSYIEPSAATSSMISLKDVLAESSEDGLKEELMYFKTEMAYADVNILIKSIYGEAPHAISNTAKKEEADIIVMGTTGASGAKEVFVGSVAAATLKQNPCPVITVPSKYEYRSLHKILFASDLKSFANQDLPQVFIDIAAISDANITVLTIQKKGELIDSKSSERGFELHSQLAQFKHDFEVLENTDVESGIAHYAKVNEVDLIVTIPRKSNWIDHLIHPSVSKKLVQHLNIPILALNA